MEAKIMQEALRSVVSDDGETLQLLVGVELTTDGEAKGSITELRKEVSLAITRLSNLLRDAKKESQGEKQILVETLQPEGRPYRVSRKTFGDEVPGIPWIQGLPLPIGLTEEKNIPLSAVRPARTQG